MTPGGAPLGRAASDVSQPVVGVVEPTKPARKKPKRKTTKRKTTKRKTAKRKTTKRASIVKRAKTVGGHKIHYTKNGQPFVIQKDGKARFIKRTKRTHTHSKKKRK